MLIKYTGNVWLHITFIQLKLAKLTTGEKHPKLYKSSILLNIKYITLGIC